MHIAKRHRTLLESWQEALKKHRDESSSEVDPQLGESKTDERSLGVVSDHDSESGECRSTSGGCSVCTALCCQKTTQPYQPIDTVLQE